MVKTKEMVGRDVFCKDCALDGICGIQARYGHRFWYHCADFVKKGKEDQEVK